MNKNLHRTNAKSSQHLADSGRIWTYCCQYTWQLSCLWNNKNTSNIYILIYIYIYIIIHQLYADGERMGKRLKICFRKRLLVIGSKPFRTVQNYFLVNSFKPFRTVRSYSLPQNDCYPTFFQIVSNSSKPFETASKLCYVLLGKK